MKDVKYGAAGEEAKRITAEKVHDGVKDDMQGLGVTEETGIQ